MRPMGLRGRVILMVLIGMLPAVWLFWMHLSEERGRLIAAAEANALRVARAWAEHHDERIREATVLLGTAAQEVAAGAACDATLERLKLAAEWPSALAVISEKGKVLCGSTEAIASLGAVDATFIDQLFDSRSVEIGEFTLDRGGHAVAYIGKRLPQVDDKAVVTTMTVEDIQRQTQPYAEGVDFKTIVLGRTGVILASAPANGELIGTQLSQTHPLRPRINFATDGTATGRGDDGLDAIFAFTQMPQTGAKVAVVLPRAAVLGPQERSMDRVLVTFLVVALVASAGAWLFAERSIVRLVRMLGETVEAFGRGDFERRAELGRGGAEFGVLAGRFNEMASLLARRQRELTDANAAVAAANEALERRVEERTAELVAAQRRLLKEERLAALGQLTATVAHELNNPLGAINNTLYVLKAESAETPALARRLGRVERSLLRCKRIIGDLLEFSRERAPRLHAAAFDAWLEAVIGEIELPPGIRCTLDLAAGSAAVEMDRALLQRAVANLVDNAVQALAADERPGAEPRLAVRTRARLGRLVLTIADSGPGIAPETLAHVFEPLFSTRSFGAGLGLPIVKRIVEQHGGEIALRSDETGTEAVISLPLAAEAEMAA